MVQASPPLPEQSTTAPAPSSKHSRAVASDAAAVYLPPAKRRLLAQQEEAKADPNSAEEQRKTWEQQKRVVHGTVNRLNEDTIKPLIHDLFDKVNLIRLRGVLTQSVLQAAVSSEHYCAVYAALIAVINTKLPEIGELAVKRAVLQFRRLYRRREKLKCQAVVVFLGHLFHQSVVHELLLLQILTVLLEGANPTDDAVEVAVHLLSVTGYALLEVSPAGVRGVLERLRALLHEGSLNKRTAVQVERLLEQRKAGFRHQTPVVPEALDLVEVDDQITFDDILLDDETLSPESNLDAFVVDPDYEKNEQTWQKIRAEVLGLGSDDEIGESETDESSGEESEEEEEPEPEESAMVPAATTATNKVVIQDLTEADLVHLRRTIYLTIMSSVTFEECAHKLAKIDIPVGREEELVNMLIECCSQERTFLRYYGLVAARFCLLDDRWRDAFMDSFAQQYNTIHRLETNKLRNVAKLFAHLLHTDSIPWSVLSIIHLNEEETTSSSRIFLKILVQEIAEAIGISKLKERFETKDPELSEWYKGMFPKDNVRNTRYSINFFTSIGLGPLTDDLREFLKNAPKLIMEQAQQAALVKKGDDGSSVSSSSSSTSSSGDESSSLSSSSYSSSSSSSGSSASSYSRGRSRRRRSRRSSRSYSRSSSRSTSSRSSSSVSSSRSRSLRDRRTSRRSRSHSSASSHSVDSREGRRRREDSVSSKESLERSQSRRSRSPSAEKKDGGVRRSHEVDRLDSPNDESGRQKQRSRHSRSSSVEMKKGSRSQRKGSRSASSVNSRPRRRRTSYSSSRSR
jgi:pre-mRNA-splicing factor CWC22